MVLNLLCFIATIFIPAKEIFYLLSISYFVFCLGYLTLKVNYIFLTTAIMVAAQFIDTYMKLQEKTFNLYSIMIYVVLFVILVVLVSAVVNMIQKKNSESNISFVIINIILIIALVLFGNAFTINTVIEKTSGFYIWTFVLYLIPLVLVNSTKDFKELYIFGLRIK